LHRVSLLLAFQKSDYVTSRESCLPQQREESSLRHVAVVPRDHGSASGYRMIENEVAPGGVIENKTLLLQKPDDFARA
jgi:hypothetical protein